MKLQLKYYFGIIVFVTTVIFYAGMLQSKVMNNEVKINDTLTLFKATHDITTSIDRRLSNIEGRLGITSR